MATGGGRGRVPDKNFEYETSSDEETITIPISLLNQLMTDPTAFRLMQMQNASGGDVSDTLPSSSRGRLRSQQVENGRTGFLNCRNSRSFDSMASLISHPIQPKNSPRSSSDPCLNWISRSAHTQSSGATGGQTRSFLSPSSVNTSPASPSISPPASSSMNKNGVKSRLNGTQTFASEHSQQRDFPYCQNANDSPRKETTPEFGARVTMKMDVSHSDHSFIIGRQGRGSQAIIHETKCHVHFPDSNRNENSAKSNQVLVSGTPTGVAHANRVIRERLPVEFAFIVKDADLHRVTAPTRFNSDASIDLEAEIKETIKMLQNRFSVTIGFHPLDEVTAAVVTVRGRQTNIQRIVEAFHELVGCLNPTDLSPNVHLTIEVSPHHLSFVVGVQEKNIKSLMERTATRIHLHVQTTTTPSTMPMVRIAGQIENVHQAWRGFMDLLPVVLLVDITDNLAATTYATGGDNAKSCRDHDASMPGSSRGSYYPTPIGAERRNSGRNLNAKDLNILKELGVFPPETLTILCSIVSGEHGNRNVFVTGLRDLMMNIGKLNTTLENFNIAITLRLSRNMHNWKLLIKGPEKYLHLLMAIHHAFSSELLDPVGYIRAITARLPNPGPI